MADIVLSEAEAERLVALPKRITQQNHWQERDGNYVMDLPVEADEQLPLRLYGRFNPRTNVFNYIFFFDKFRVRALDVGKRHHNPDCDNVGPTHLHKWTDQNRDKWAEEFDDTFSLGDAFGYMLDECNIDYQESFKLPPQGYQRGF